jgi:hypothetical protein
MIDSIAQFEGTESSDFTINLKRFCRQTARSDAEREATQAAMDMLEHFG